MNRLRPIFLAVAVVVSALLAYGFLTLPKAQPSDAEGFSAARVLEDIEVISRKHHSVAHPEERAEVRDYLVGRLEGMGGNVSLYTYDSIPGPKILGDSFVFEAVDILAEFPPVEASEDPTYLMFVAHYDSRHLHPMPKDTVLSYGAADDGYGIGVILESVSELLEVRQDWKQGIKVLFTDAEESGMLGMEAIWENDRQVFDNVGFLINIEGRGTWGPALLFETCPGNEKIMDLYAETSKYKYTYSLTSVVYSFLPTFTDFTIVMDDVPGVNFSTIAEVNHYHTDLDNFDNVNAASVQHYGAQILPLAMRYLTDPVFADKDYLMGEKNTVNFTVPALGLFNVSKTAYMIINIIVFVLFVLLVALEALRGRVKAMDIVKQACVVLCLAISVLAIGELVAYVSAVIVGARFKPFGIVQGVPFDNFVMAMAMVLMVVIVVAIYLVTRTAAIRQTSGSMRASAASNAAEKHAFKMLYGALMLTFVLSVVLVFAIGENFMFLIPLTCAALAMILWHITSLKVWLVAAMVVIMLHAFSFLFALSMALSIGALGAVMMIAFCDVMVLVPLADIYMMNTRN